MRGPRLADLYCLPPENRRFIEVLVANKKRLRALQEFNIDGALAELDREAQQRKDRGEDASSTHSPLSASRPASFDSAGGPPAAASARTSSLGDVPENDRFAIGDDNEEEEEEDVEEDDDEETPQASSAADASTTTSQAEGASSPRLSKKARGKQPAVSIASASSRTPSTTSLTALNNTPTQPATSSNSETQFRPTHEWLDTWLPQLQARLTPLLHTIELAEKKQIQFVDTALRPTNGDFPSTPSQEKQPSEYGREAPQSTGLARQPQDGGGATAQTPRPDGQSPFKTPGKSTFHYSNLFNVQNLTSTSQELKHQQQHQQQPQVEEATPKKASNGQPSQSAGTPR